MDTYSERDEDARRDEEVRARRRLFEIWAHAGPRTRESIREAWEASQRTSAPTLVLRDLIRGLDRRDLEDR